VSESIRTAPLFIDAHPARRRRAARPTAREWRRHTALFLLTALTATIAGVMLLGSSELPEPNMPLPAHWAGYILYVPEYYLRQVGLLIHEALAHPSLLVQGLTFACALLAILTAHEAGHYIACRRYGVDATLPFFIPAPPLFMAGTFGAFIKIKSPIPSRRALFDIGVAGPLAGFIVALPIALAGVLMLEPSRTPMLDGAIILNDPPLFRLMAHAFGVNLLNAQGGPFYFAAWIGLLVTSLNLMPVGQLDGGHATYSVFGLRAHRWMGHAAFLIVASLAILGWHWHRSPSGFLYAVLLAVMLRLRHPQPEDDRPLDRARLIVALITLLVFALSFTPFPITIT
jgi:membrane-associated protease RseP (regulator of RpoE activity)